MKFKKIVGLAMATIMTVGVASVSFAETESSDDALEDQFHGIRDLNDDSNYILYNPKTKELKLGPGYKYEKDSGRIYGRGEEFVLDSETGNILPAGEEERDETRYSADDIRTYDVKGGKIYYNTSGSITGADKNITSCFIPRVMPDGIRIKMIKSGAFAYCQNLKEVSLPSSIKNIEANAFDCCTKLKSINIPSGVISISNRAFSSCKALESVTIPKTVNSIGSHAFGSCDSLTNFVISSTIQDVIDNNSNIFYGSKALKNIVISSGVKRVEANILGKLDNLENSGKIQYITIPKSVEFIDVSLFENFNKNSNKNSEENTQTKSALTIRCFENSYAAKFAAENNIPYVYIKDDSVLMPYIEETTAPSEKTEESTSETTTIAQ